MLTCGRIFLNNLIEKTTLKTMLNHEQTQDIKPYVHHKKPEGYRR